MSPRDRDDDTGEFSQQYERWEFLGAIEELDTPTTAAVADEVGCSYNLAYRRLHGLEEDGFVTKDNVGGTFLWRRDN